MRKLFLACALGLSIIGNGCATSQNAPASYTPDTIQKYNLTQLSNAIGTLQLAAENAVPKKILPLNTARLIVQFCVGANQAIVASPSGWKATVNSSYTYMKSQLTEADRTKFAVELTAFEVVLNSF